jgi:hypothetical protein
MMKIGLSYSRCVRDIVDGVVDIEDVLVIIARTDFDPRDDDQWSSIWTGYGGGNGGSGSIWSRPEWGAYSPEDEVKFRDVSTALYQQGKLHQPRQFGAHPRRLPYYWLETVLPQTELDRHPAVAEAWNNFQVVAGLTNTKLDAEH